MKETQIKTSFLKCKIRKKIRKKVSIIKLIKYSTFEIENQKVFKTQKQGKFRGERIRFKDFQKIDLIIYEGAKGE